MCYNHNIVAKGLCRKHYMQSYRRREGAKAYEKAAFDKWISKDDNKTKYLNKKRELRQTQEYKNRVNTYRKERYHRDDNFKLSCVVRSHLNRIAKCSYSKIDYSMNELKQHLELQFQEGMSWDNHGEWHIDHIKPLASFDLTREEERRVAYSIDNLQPLWAKDNLSKGARRAKV